MTTLRQAAQQALEALEWHYQQGHSNTLGGFRLKIDEKAIRTLKAALAQPEQEPNIGALGMPVNVPVTPPAAQRKSLTDEQVKKLLLIGPVYATDGVVTRTPYAYRKELLATAKWAFRKAEAAHGIKEGT